MQKIASFTVNHDNIGVGLYISRIDGDITTYDMRTRRPNMGDYMDNLTMHSVEHMFATYVRNSEMSDKIIYFGPMGCQTGFYLLVRDLEPADVLTLIKETLIKIISHKGEIFGNKREECGNYRNLNLESAQIECQRYLDALNSTEVTFKYE
ncbi:MAG: S-ribosylhomocysteine lyase [Ruminococcaceae bacterium]|nr:S-ribosylhomocysteine lyase [Oscillospiraceae bacterium]